MNFPFYFILFVGGVIFGSFLNAWEWRLRSGKQIARGRSVCRSCNTQLRWFENIPLGSFVFLRGACRTCKKPISIQYPIVELAFGLLFAFVGWIHHVPHVADASLFARDLFLVFVLGFIFIYDAKYQEIPDSISLSSTALLVCGNAVFGWVSWQSMAVGAIIGAGFFLLQYAISKGTWIGGGDIRLGLLMGVVLGWPLTVFALLFAYVTGATTSVPFLASGKKHMASAVPFGTYLSVATLVALWWGNAIIEWYLGLI